LVAVTAGVTLFGFNPVNLLALDGADVVFGVNGLTLLFFLGAPMRMGFFGSVADLEVVAGLTRVGFAFLVGGLGLSSLIAEEVDWIIRHRSNYLANE